MDNFYEEIDLIDNQLNVNPIDFSNWQQVQKEGCCRFLGCHFEAPARWEPEIA